MQITMDAEEIRRDPCLRILVANLAAWFRIIPSSGVYNGHERDEKAVINIKLPYEIRTSARVYRILKPTQDLLGNIDCERPGCSYPGRWAAVWTEPDGAIRTDWICAFHANQFRRQNHVPEWHMFDGTPEELRSDYKERISGA
jgi:hypothetical protein